MGNPSSREISDLQFYREMRNYVRANISNLIVKILEYLFSKSKWEKTFELFDRFKDLKSFTFFQKARNNYLFLKSNFLKSDYLGSAGNFLN